ncbi:MAG: riboflavin biosynthesis protein RibF [Clostridia bacterium]|nr:riboflavin biosynthesis protein RibF [Clostridia bacterium]
MQILSLPDMTPVPRVLPGGVWVLGFFDGVHAGHQKLLSSACALAARNGRPDGVGVWTFSSLPKAKELLTDPAERSALLGQYGVKQLALTAFEEVSHLSGEAFFREVLLEKFAPSAIVCGFNFRFGHGGESSAADLLRWGEESGVQVQIVPPCEADGRPVSSTWIRNLVREGNTAGAMRLLTRPYSITGVVEHGKALGRKLGFPTANIRLPVGKAAPAPGVYACMAGFTGKDGIRRKKPGVCNIGYRPTVNGDREDITVETWILDFMGDLYGLPMEIFLYEKLRDERRFDTLESLTAQVLEDGARVRAMFPEVSG